MRLLIMLCAGAAAVAWPLLFCVTNEGSWREIGNSVSHLVLAAALSVQLPVAVGMARVLIGTSVVSSRLD